MNRVAVLESHHNCRVCIGCFIIVVRGSSPQSLCLSLGVIEKNTGYAGRKGVGQRRQRVEYTRLLLYYSCVRSTPLHS